MTKKRSDIAAALEAAEEAAPPGAFPPDDGGGGDRAPPETIAACARQPHNDTGNGQRLLLNFGADIRHVREVGWHVWTGSHWEPEGGLEAVIRYAQRMAPRILDEREHIVLTGLDAEAVAKAKAEGDAAPDSVKDRAAAALARLRGMRAALWKFGKSSGNGDRISKAIAAALPHTTIRPAELDRDPLAFNCANGTLRFFRARDDEAPDPDVIRFRWSVRRDDHRREDLIAKAADAVFDPDARCPRWTEFLERFQPDPAVRRFLQEFHGYALTGLSADQVLVFNWGGGANGKSTFIEAIARLMGPYAHTLNPESFTGQHQRRGDQATPDFATLPGARLLRVSELPRDAKINETLVKALTGGEPMKVRHLNKGFFDFRPEFKASMSGNDKPEIHGVDHGIWRRIMLAPWTVTIPDAERRPFEEVQAEFEAERSGILNWLIDGALAYLDRGRLDPPEAVRALTAEHRAEMDPVGRFIEACLPEYPGLDVTARAAFDAFSAWCEANNIRPFSEKRFSQVMAQKGVRKRDGRVRQYLDRMLDGVPERPSRNPHGGPDGGARGDRW
jgi:putative DNA primase/helicase